MGGAVMGIKIDRDKCVLCEACVASCPNGALSSGDEICIDEEKCILCGACVNNCPMEAITLEKEQAAADAGSSGIWVAVQQQDGRPIPAALELIYKARELADIKKCTVTAVCPGKGSGFEKELIEAGADEVIFCISENMADSDDDAYARILIPLIKERNPETVLFSATILGRSAAPRIAAKLGTGLTADCTALSIDPDTGLLAQTRPALGGNLMATILCPGTRPQMATIRPGIFPAPVPDETRTGKAEYLRAGDITGRGFEIISAEAKKESGGISNAEVLLVAGRGIGSAKNLKKVFELAELMGAKVGVSRPLIDMGWAEYPHQVGQTGATVAPKLLISLGVSGAIQHLAGMGGAKTVVAVNTDEAAPITRQADHVIHMDCVEFVDELTKSFKERKER